MLSGLYPFAGAAGVRRDTIDTQTNYPKRLSVIYSGWDEAGARDGTISARFNDGGGTAQGLSASQL